ncbi:heptaprenyl diphosphate synthase [Halanaerobium saccharolyticum]|uniref:Heptaprenyl diphosphate synthase n=1 Tax=Halanaerobium saccharolyticum TaxID=43595 RepID=A0A4R6LJG4_9FIRM|nr:polyprenyl synthetase family protein [Halanaerobium saccharolyticum]TDO83386.1 heptaprenyl diphosphate synthase [Halanaerobium saccharolyticum]
MLIEDKLYQKIRKELNENIIKITKSKRPIINQAVEDLINGGGKKLRPFLMFLAASFGDYDKEKLLQLGSGIELLHMASLVHDDIIDNAALRRGKKTAQKRFGKKEAVFIGDFLLSRTFDIFFEYLDKKTLRKMNKNVRLLCEGEIEQSEKRFDFQIGIRDYYRRIRHKTALLFALSSYLGAYVSGIRGRRLNILYKLGLEIGMAFQIQDDLLDFEGNEKETGKLLAQDLKEGVITLPVILLLNKDKYKNKYEVYNKTILNDKVVNEIIADVKSSGVLEESRDILHLFISRVKKYLVQLPDNKAKKKLKKLIEVQVERKF